MFIALLLSVHVVSYYLVYSFYFKVSKHNKYYVETSHWVLRKMTKESHQFGFDFYFKGDFNTIHITSSASIPKRIEKVSTDENKYNLFQLRYFMCY